MEVTKELQPQWNSIILDVLREFINICKHHGLTYYCAYGTVIGAVRHHGMIPWDDDIDVYMPRPDYERFLDITSKIDLGNYEVVSPYTNNSYPLYFAKMCNKRTTLIEVADTPCVIGLYIDIFPLDGASDNLDETRTMIARFMKIRNKLEAISTHNKFGDYLKLALQPKEWGRFVYKTHGFFFRNSYRKKLLLQLETIARKYNYNESNYVAMYFGCYGKKEVFPKSWLQNTAQCDFEGMTVDLPGEFEKYLEHYYGDYMQLPPESESVPRHQKAFFNLEERLPDDIALSHIRR